MEIIHRKKIWFSISAMIMLVAILFISFTGVNTGIDFTGGTIMEFDFKQQVEVNDIRQITDTFDTDASINFIGSGQEQVQIRTIIDMNHQERMKVFSMLQETYDIIEDDFIRAEQFGPSIGKEIQNRAYLSILIASIGMLIYITLRFELSFGLAAIAALLHDILIVVAIFIIFQIPINSPFVAAMLTVLGYSINDTIVVFDRIRENRKIMKKYDYVSLTTDSIRQTVRRSLYTSATTLITIIALYILGVPMIKDFALPLIAGIISGTYSSIFIASPIWVMLKERSKDPSKSFSKA
ncbi:protein translocase subunit SecF [Tindallia californiensis]|uniref:Protein-export membrane protein SecF n=1 Tax=Tindallia californiensis TaxID=159292 RepID=A0A1H3NEI1_9FIRM|nr:protein translocase subunit SecF [Tindallia californiensis]SDY87322.1 protein translocase subunit secF [Tindallia californiensis]